MTNSVLVALRAREAVLQQTVPGQSPDQQIDLFVAVSFAGCERRQRQTLAQVLHALGGAGAEGSQADRTATETGGDFSVRLHFECHVAVEPCGEAWPHGPPSLFYSGRAHGRDDLRYGGEPD